MAQYITGTASVANGSASVAGAGTAWLTNVTVGNSFKFQGEDAYYNVNSVDSDGALTISPVYAGASKTNAAYIIARDFTDKGFYELTSNDVDWAFFWTLNARKMASTFNSFGALTVPEDFATLEIARTSADAVGKTMTVTSALTLAQSNITAAWPADRALRIEKGGSLLNSTAFAFTDGNCFSADLSPCFLGAGSISGLVEIRPEWFPSLSAAGSIASTPIKLSASYTSDDPNIAQIGNAILEPLASVSNSIYDGIVQTHAGKAWLHHNHLEEDEVSLGSHAAITSGNIPAPPVSSANANHGIDIIAHWYQDFGLEAKRAVATTHNDLGWYYWSWNFHSGTYHADRHPLLGFYRGDDPNVLDWQCYWLREHGVKAVSLTTTGIVDSATWDDPTDKNYCIYQLLNNVPNMKGLQYILWGAYTGSNAVITAQWVDMVTNIYLAYCNFYCIEHNGRLYPVIYVFEASLLYTNLGSSVATTTALFTAIRDLFQAQGYGGVAIFARHPKGDVTLVRSTLENADILYYTADYSCNGAWLNVASSSTAVPIIDYASTTYQAQFESYSPVHERPEWASGASYAADDVVRRKGWFYISRSAHTSSDNDTPGEGKNWASTGFWYRLGSVKREILSIPTSKHAVAPHPSTGGAGWLAAGSTPELFRQWLQRAFDSIMTNNLPRICMIYNVSEWAEGGAGLQPNMQDGFGYLEALSQALTRTRKPVLDSNVFPKVADTVQPVFVVAASTIPSSYDRIRLSTDAARTMGPTTPTIAPGIDGQRLWLTNVNTSAWDITLQDNATLSGSKLFLSAATVVLTPNKSILLEYNSGATGWIQVV